MRRPFAIGLLILLILPRAGFADEVRRTNVTNEVVEVSDTAVRKNGLLLVRGEPFTGILIEHFAEGGLKSRTCFAGGRQDGLSESWHANGRTNEVRQYRNGRKEGDNKGWWPNGKPRFEFHFRDGVYDGTCQEWYENGQLYRLNHFVAGEEVGAQRLWYDDGRVLANYVVKDGRRFGLTGAMGCYSVTK